MPRILKLVGAERSLQPLVYGAGEAPWVYRALTDQGEVLAPELTERRTVDSKVFGLGLDARGNPQYITEAQNARHYRPDGLSGKEAFRDIDLSDPDNLRAQYALTRTAGIGYTYQSREPGAPAITVEMTGIPRSPRVLKPEVREGGVVYYADVDTELDVYTKPLPDRYGIFKVLKGPNASRKFTFTWSASKAPIRAVATDREYTGTELAAKLTAGLAVRDLWFEKCVMPARVAWDGAGKRVEVIATVKGQTITEEVVIPEGVTWPVTVDTDVEEQVGASGDDGWWISGAAIATGGNTVEFGNSYHAWTRYASVAADKGAEVSGGEVQFYPLGPQTSTVCRVKVHLNNADSATAPTTHAGADALALTTGLTWTVPQWPWSSPYWQSTLDINSEIQTVLGRNGWASGNPMMVVIKDNGSDAAAMRQAYAYELAGSDYAPKLVFAWSAGGGEPITLSGRSATATRSAASLNTAVSLAGRSATATRSAAVISAVVYPAARSATPTRSALSVDVVVQVHIRSPTSTRSAAELDTGIGIAGRSGTGTRSAAALDASAHLSGRSVTGTRSAAALETPLSLAGQSQTGTRSTAELDATIALAGISATATRSAVSLISAIILAGRSATGTRSFAALDVGGELGVQTKPATDITSVSARLHGSLTLPVGGEG